MSALTNAMADVKLQSGERLLWHGRPRSDKWLQSSDVLLIPFSLMWGGFAIFWEASVLANHHARSSILFPLWGIPFVLLGLYLIAGRFFVRRWKLRHTTYALTNRRALSITPSFRGRHQESNVWCAPIPSLKRAAVATAAGPCLLEARDSAPAPSSPIQDGRLSGA